MVKNTGRGSNELAEAVQSAYNSGQTDYYMEPIVAEDRTGIPIGRIRNGDAVVFCCRRGEREIQLTDAFTDPDFKPFPRPDLEDLRFVILTLYHEKFKDLPVAFAPVKIQNTLGEIASRAGLTQLRVAESEKFAHVTFFLNGGNSQPYPGETDIRIPSPKGIPFDQVPQLSLAEVSAEVRKGLTGGIDLIITNFANGDVIGHTSSNDAKIKCAEVVDQYLGEVIQTARENDYLVLITADHGNLEEMVAEDGSPHVAHTSNPVPFLALDQKVKLQDGVLADIAPTVCSLLNISAPAAVSGRNLINSPEPGKKQKVLLIILDGWGIGKSDSTNPIHIANTPVWDRLLKEFPHSRLEASGEHVGLKPGKAGNSEAGHMNIGAGCIVLQDDVRLDQAMKDGSFFNNEVILEAIQYARDKGSALHLIGLLTEKSSHGSMDYPLAVLQMAKDQGFQNVFLHMILDGRSTAPGSAPALLKLLEGRMDRSGIGEIVSCIGRGIALDRDGNYQKTRKAFDAFVSGTGTRVTR